MRLSRLLSLPVAVEEFEITLLSGLVTFGVVPWSVDCCWWPVLPLLLPSLLPSGRRLASSELTRLVLLPLRSLVVRCPKLIGAQYELLCDSGVGM